MPIPWQATIPSPCSQADWFEPLEDPGCCPLSEAPAVYRPRHPERTAFYRLFQDHFDSYVRAYEERFEPRSGPLRPVVVRSVEEFLSCGRLQGGFARIRCPKCRAEHLLAFSCRTRNFCSSWQAKGLSMNNVYTLARAPGGQMQGAATQAMPVRIVEEV